MEDNSSDPPKEEKEKAEEAAVAAIPGNGIGGSRWGGWGLSSFSVFSDLQKAAEEISRNAFEAAKTAAKNIAELEEGTEDSESSKEEDRDGSAVEEVNEDDSDERRKAALEKLENASEDSLLGQGLKVIDSSVENFASGAWQALGSAWKGGSEFVHKLENSAVNLADSIQHRGLPATDSVAPLIESGKAFTSKGMQVLELVGKETVDLFINETGFGDEKNQKDGQAQDDEDHLLEEVTFDRCFYIYGGPEQLEELEALSDHYAMLFNRRKVKLPSEQKSLYDGKLKQLQQIFVLSSEVDGSATESEKGKKVETEAEKGGDEMKRLRDASISKAAEMAAGFTNALTGLASNDIMQRTAGRLEALHSEGVHRLSELCCCAVSQLLVLGKSVIFNSKVNNEDESDDVLKIDWPEDSIEKAKIIRTRADLMTRDVEAVCNSFITGIVDVAEACAAAIEGASADSQVPPKKSVQDRANVFSKNLRSDRMTALGKVQEGLHYMPYLLLSTSVLAT